MAMIHVCPWRRRHLRWGESWPEMPPTLLYRVSQKQSSQGGLAGGSGIELQQPPLPIPLPTNAQSLFECPHC